MKKGGGSLESVADLSPKNVRLRALPVLQITSDNGPCRRRSWILMIRTIRSRSGTRTLSFRLTVGGHCAATVFQIPVAVLPPIPTQYGCLIGLTPLPVGKLPVGK